MRCKLEYIGKIANPSTQCLLQEDMKPTCKVNVELRLVKRRTQADYIVDPFFPQQKRGEGSLHLS